ncbi:hypothetical protein L195_g026508 [Trifolium pratense]|uniref:Uncharacterized protein n=1 Tax=Trifolium pratense TaxID=57577 RepID=A0A2K3NJG8_TRIPR|nr:hypothetical protein L195_g026508 [Trifolium pratense]
MGSLTLKVPRDHVTIAGTNQSPQGGKKCQVDSPLGVNTRLLLIIHLGGTVTLLLVDIIAIHHEVTKKSLEDHFREGL